MHTSFTFSVDVRVVLGLSSHFVYQGLPLFWPNFFPNPISIRIETVWVHLPLFWNYAYLFYIFWRCACDFRGLSSYYFFIYFSTCSTHFLLGLISIRICTLWAQPPYTFPPIILKLPMLVLHGLKMENVHVV